MRLKTSPRSPLHVLLLLTLAFAPWAVAQGLFTVQVGSPSSTSLVAPGDVWRYHKGTNAPVAGWQTNAETSLDISWLSGAGGFGYADNVPEVAFVRTPLPDMQNLYSTLYVRRSFEIRNSPDPAQVLQLVMDWDDGFVAWLDGVELSPRMNAPGGVGTEPGAGATATTTHESSRGNGGPQPAMTFSLGPVGSRLQPGTHVLAVLGLNQATNSSDFVLVPELLAVDGGASGVVNGSLLSIVRSNSVVLSGSNTIPGSARVLVDGAEAQFGSVSGTWSRTASLKPGFNRLLLQALDSGGAQLYATNQDIISEMSSTAIGGPLPAQTSLTSDMGIFHVTNSIVLPAGSSLSIGPGCVFVLSPGASFLVTNASLTASGTEGEPVVFAPADGTTVWGGLIGSGTGSRIQARNVETIAGRLELLDGAEAIFEDGYFHDYTVSSPPIIHTLGQPNHCTLTLRRCHVSRYYEILCQLSTNRFEDCLMEYQAQGGDGIDFDGGQPGSFIRRCTLRHGKFTNVDALDMGEFDTGEPSHGVVIDSCLLYDFVDKGVSMGVQVDVTVTNCLIHHLDSGIAVKDLSTAGIYSCTIVSNNFGFHCYNKAAPSSPTGGGLITNSFNNILWNNGQSLALLNGSTLTASYSDFQDLTVPGPGNLSVDPQWRNPAEMDYRTGAGSTVVVAGREGATMGATFPVGAAMAASHPVINAIEVQGASIVVRFWADSERTYSLLGSEAIVGGAWTTIADVFPAPLPRKIAVTNTVSSGQNRFYRLVTPRL